MGSGSYKNQFIVGKAIYQKPIGFNVALNEGRIGSDQRVRSIDREIERFAAFKLVHDHNQKSHVVSAFGAGFKIALEFFMLVDAILAHLTLLPILFLIRQEFRQPFV